MLQHEKRKRVPAVVSGGGLTWAAKCMTVSISSLSRMWATRSKDWMHPRTNLKLGRSITELTLLVVAQ